MVILINTCKEIGGKRQHPLEAEISSSDKVDLGWIEMRQINSLVSEPKFIRFLRATAGTAKRVSAIVILSVRPSVTTRYRFKPIGEIETPGFLVNKFRVAA